MNSNNKQNNQASKATGDQSFDGITHKFSHNIYATTKGRLRLAVLKRDLQPWLTRAKQRPLKILDIGGGLGQVSQWFAELGCNIMHTDISAEIVAAAQQQHAQTGLAQRYQYLVAPLQQLPEQVADDYDLILCHAVLEWLADPAAAIALLPQLLAPQGGISLMFYNKDAKVLANVIFGNFDYVEAGLTVKKKVRLSPQQPLAPAHVAQWLEQAGLQIEYKTGVRCFHDYLKNAADKERFEQLLALELRYNQQAPFCDIGRYLHWQLKRA